MILTPRPRWPVPPGFQGPVQNDRDCCAGPGQAGAKPQANDSREREAGLQWEQPLGDCSSSLTARLSLNMG